MTVISMATWRSTEARAHARVVRGSLALGTLGGDPQGATRLAILRGDIALKECLVGSHRD